MPTSRRRRPRRPSSVHDQRHRRRAATFPDELRPMLEVAMRADAAEARGDAVAALDELTSRPYGPDGRPWWRPWRMTRLAQLVAYDGHLPRWATSRWVLDQALQCLDHDSGDRVSRALLVALSTGAATLLPPGLDELEVRCRITDRDWVFRQVFLYELGGLDTFVRVIAAPDLVMAADDLQAWMRSTLDAYRLVGSDSLHVTWEHLATGRLVVVDNLGCAALVKPGEHAIGRLVPIEGGEMFETSPLRVPEVVALEVAADPTSWIEVLRDHAGDDETIRTSGFVFGLLHDVHPVVWEVVLIDAVAAVDGSRPVSDPTELAHPLLSVVRQAFGPDAAPGLRPDRHPDDIDGWPCVGAALLDPTVLAELSQLVRPSDAAVFGALAQALPEPAATACRTVVLSCRSVA